MTWVDGVILAVLAVSAILAFFRGLVREVLGVGAWIGAILAAFVALPAVAPLIAPHVEPPWLVDALAVGGVFLVVLLLLKLVIAWIANRVQSSVLGSLDRALGLVFGLARGAFIAVLAYIVAGLFLPAVERWPEAVRDARALPLVAEGAGWLVAQLPEEFRPRLPEPPDRPAPSMDQLLRPPARSRI
jgi:membrane protein required for colicin V production